MLKDKLLIWKLNRGSKDALRTIYVRYKDDLLRISSSLLIDRSDAEDIVHEVFAVFVANASTFKLTGSLKGYLARCVVNKARNMNRSKLRQRTVSVDDMDVMALELHRPDKWIIDDQQFRQITDAMAKLPYQQREAVVLHLQGGMKFREIAQIQESSIKTVQSRYRYGLERLRSILNCEASG